MFNFTAHFFENEIYINNKFAYNNNEFLTELLNLEIIEDLNKFRDILTKQFKNLFFYGDMQDYEIENYHKHAQNVQSTMRRLDFLFAKFSISNLGNILQWQYKYFEKNCFTKSRNLNVILDGLLRISVNL